MPSPRANYIYQSERTSEYKLNRLKHLKDNNGAHIGLTDTNNIAENDQHCSSVYSVWIKHLFNGIVFTFQPLIVAQGPYIWWSLR
eukprot:11374599-Heterocapsa_arctica.AAC.1